MPSFHGERSGVKRSQRRYQSSKLNPMLNMVYIRSFTSWTITRAPFGTPTNVHCPFGNELLDLRTGTPIPEGCQDADLPIHCRIFGVAITIPLSLRQSARMQNHPTHMKDKNKRLVNPSQHLQYWTRCWHGSKNNQRYPKSRIATVNPTKKNQTRKGAARV
jgi:hypothetical protein